MSYAERKIGIFNMRAKCPKCGSVRVVVRETACPDCGVPMRATAARKVRNPSLPFRTSDTAKRTANAVALNRRLRVS